MSDTAGDKAGASADDEEIEILAEARAHTDAEFKEVFERVAQRHRGAVLTLQQGRLLHERGVTDRALRRLRRLTAHYEELLSIKDVTIASMRTGVEVWKEVARRHGAKVDDDEPAPQRGH